MPLINDFGEQFQIEWTGGDEPILMMWETVTPNAEFTFEYDAEAGELVITHDGEKADRGVRKNASQLGAPQGALTSGRVAVAVLAPELESLAGYGEGILYGDDILVAASTYDKALAAQRDLAHLLERHPAGPLRLKHAYVRSGDKGYWFDFLGYRFERSGLNTGSYFRARPSKKSFDRFQTRARTIFKNEVENSSASDPVVAVEQYADKWKASYKSWDVHAGSARLFEDTITEAITDAGHEVVLSDDNHA